MACSSDGINERMVGLRSLARLRKSGLEARRRRKPCLSEGFNEKMVGLRSLARLKKSRPGGQEAQNGVF